MCAIETRAKLREYIEMGYAEEKGLKDAKNTKAITIPTRLVVGIALHAEGMSDLIANLDEPQRDRKRYRPGRHESTSIPCFCPRCDGRPRDPRTVKQHCSLGAVELELESDYDRDAVDADVEDANDQDDVDAESDRDDHVAEEKLAMDFMSPAAAAVGELHLSRFAGLPASENQGDNHNALEDFQESSSTSSTDMDESGSGQCASSNIVTTHIICDS
jgi:hypothetical protein